ncbi:serine-protein kinase ATM [Nematocida sp. AWRm80]|nr:serine-protein kinase ATM [Nematocida sp. AWRm80]
MRKTLREIYNMLVGKKGVLSPEETIRIRSLLKGPLSETEIHSIMVGIAIYLNSYITEVSRSQTSTIKENKIKENSNKSNNKNSQLEDSRKQIVHNINQTMDLMHRLVYTLTTTNRNNEYTCSKALVQLEEQIINRIIKIKEYLGISSIILLRKILSMLALQKEYLNDSTKVSILTKTTEIDYHKETRTEVSLIEEYLSQLILSVKDHRTNVLSYTLLGITRGLFGLQRVFVEVSMQKEYSLEDIFVEIDRYKERLKETLVYHRTPRGSIFILWIFLYLYHSNESIEWILIFCIQESNNREVPDTLVISTLEDTLKLNNLLVPLGIMIHITNRMDLIENKELKWSILAIDAMIYCTYTQESIIQAALLHSDESLLYLLTVSMIDTELTKGVYLEYISALDTFSSDILLYLSIYHEKYTRLDRLDDSYKTNKIDILNRTSNIDRTSVLEDKEEEIANILQKYSKLSNGTTVDNSYLNSINALSIGSIETEHKRQERQNKFLFRTLLLHLLLIQDSSVVHKCIEDNCITEYGLNAFLEKGYPLVVLNTELLSVLGERIPELCISLSERISLVPQISTEITTRLLDHMHIFTGTPKEHTWTIFVSGILSYLNISYSPSLSVSSILRVSKNHKLLTGAIRSLCLSSNQDKIDKIDITSDVTDTASILEKINAILSKLSENISKDNKNAMLYRILTETSNQSIRNIIYKHLMNTVPIDKQNTLEYIKLHQDTTNRYIRLTDRQSIFKEIVNSTREIISILKESVDINDVSYCNQLANKKQEYFKRVSALSPREQSMIRRILKESYLCYSTLERSTRILYDQKRKEQFKMIEAVHSVMNAHYPEKILLYQMIIDALEEYKLSTLQCYALHNLIEYTYAYNYQIYTRLHRRYKEVTAKDQIGIKKIQFRRTGTLFQIKEQIQLAKYQNKFFTDHYNCKNTNEIIAEYFSGIARISSIQMVLFISQMPKDLIQIIEQVPCDSSRSYLKIYAYRDHLISISPKDIYYDISRFFQTDTVRAYNKNSKDTRVSIDNKPNVNRVDTIDTTTGIFKESLELSLYANRENNDVIDTQVERENNKSISLLLDVDQVLRAIDQLSRWSTSIDAEESIKYIQGTLTTSDSSSQEYTNFILYKPVQDRYRFLQALRDRKRYSYRTEVEEMLYICSREINKSVIALDNKRYLSKSSVHTVVSALERKWLGASSETVLSGLLCKNIPSSNEPAISTLSSLFFSQRHSSLEDTLDLCSDPKYILAANLLAVKIEEGTFVSKTQLDLLSKIETECKRVLSNRPNAICSELYFLLARTILVKISHTVREFQQNPIEILTSQIEPARHLEYKEYRPKVLDRLIKACLTLFNRDTNRVPVPENTPSKSTSKGMSLLRKEQELVQSITKARIIQATKVKELSLTIGIDLCIELSESVFKNEYIICLIHLLFSDAIPSGLLERISLENIPIKSFLPFKEQIISKYFSIREHPEKSILKEHLRKIIDRLINKYKYSVVYDILLREENIHANTSSRDQDISTQSILSPDLRSIGIQVISSYQTILSIAQSGLPITQTIPKDIPVLTADFTEKNTPTIIKVLEESKRLKGINAPVYIKVLGSDGKLYKEILKANDDLTQDILGTQALTYMNSILAQNNTCYPIKERVRTYNIIALKRRFGVIGFISDAEPLGTIVEALHKKYYPNEISSRECRNLMQDLGNSSLENKVDRLHSIFSKYSPVLNYLFTGTGPFDYFKQRKTFSNSFGLISIATYILGLGDRHPYNILIDLSTKEMINIDLNLLFDQGLLLSVSEKVPFRMTRNIEVSLLNTYPHSYTQVMESFLDALKGCKEYLLVLIQILKNEPLGRWKIIQGLTQTERLFSDPRSIQERVSEKLNGVEEGFILSTTAQIQCLIQRATSLPNLASIYPGWAPWI